MALPVQNYLQPAQRLTRRSTKESFIELHTRVDTYKHSYVPKTTKEWNGLSKKLKSIDDPEDFKASLIEHFKPKKETKRD